MSIVKTVTIPTGLVADAIETFSDGWDSEGGQAKAAYASAKLDLELAAYIRARVVAWRRSQVVVDNTYAVTSE